MIRIRRGMASQRRRAAVLSMIALIAAVVALEHAGASAHEMSSDGMPSEGMTMTIGVCLGVLGLAIAGVAVLPILAARAMCRRPRSVLIPVVARFAHRTLAPPARAGPALLQVVLR